MPTIMLKATVANVVFPKVSPFSHIIDQGKRKGEHLPAFQS